MNDERFEKLKKIAKEEFGVEIVRREETSNFKEVFGFDVEIARQIGTHACVEKLGREFVKAHKDSSTSAWGECEDGVFCFVGVNDKGMGMDDYSLVLDNASRFPYRASCVVRLSDGAVTWREVVVPEK